MVWLACEVLALSAQNTDHHLGVLLFPDGCLVGGSGAVDMLVLGDLAPTSNYMSRTRTIFNYQKGLNFF